MYHATLTFADRWNDTYIRTVDHSQQDAFYAILAGTIQGNLNAGSTLVAMERTLHYATH